jgi:ribosomal protein L9
MNVFILTEDIAPLAKKGEQFVLCDGYYTNSPETLFIKSSNKNYKLFSHKKTKADYANRTK